MKPRVFLSTLLLMFLFLASARAATLVVCPDGTADFSSLTTAVQAASPGDQIRLRAGTYDGTSETFPIALDKRLTIIGDAGVTLDSPRFQTLLRVTADDVTLESLRFNVRKWGVVAAQSSRMTVRNCTFALADPECRTSSAAIWMEGMKECSLIGCAFNGVSVCVAGDPLSAQSAGKAVLTGLCEVGENPAYFVGHEIENCTVNGKPLYYITNQKDVTVPADAGGMIVAYCEDVTVRGADVSDSSMGLEIVHCQNVTIEGVTADRCGIFGTYVAFAEGGMIQNVTVRGTNHGIDTRASTNVTIKNCLAENCEQGIFFSMCADCAMDSCKIKDCGFGCFAAVGTGLRAARNVCEGNADGIYLQNEKNATVTDCVINGSTVVGLRVLKSSALCENTGFQNNWTGAILYDSEDVTIRGCSFSASGSVNLYMAYARGTEIADCAFSGDSGAHLELDGTFSDTVVRGCAFTGDERMMIRRKAQDAPLFIDNLWEPARVD